MGSAEAADVSEPDASVESSLEQATNPNKDAHTRVTAASCLQEVRAMGLPFG